VKPEETPKAAAYPSITTNIASHDLHSIHIRGHDLATSLMGGRSFSEVVFLMLAKRLPDADEARLVDAILVSLVEHGLTPSAIVTRMTYATAPESVQGAVAAGLLCAGSAVLGSMEECGRLLSRIHHGVQCGGTSEACAVQIVQEYRLAHRNIPGIGHSIHTEGDPRAARLMALAEECGRRTLYIGYLADLAGAAERLVGKSLPINVTGATAAILLELSIPWQVHRGFALIARSAGLVAHIDEEMDVPIAPTLRAIGRGATGG
jgi:citrate synthase